MDLAQIIHFYYTLETDTEVYKAGDTVVWKFYVWVEGCQNGNLTSRIFNVLANSICPVSEAMSWALILVDFSDSDVAVKIGKTGLTVSPAASPIAYMMFCHSR